MVYNRYNRTITGHFKPFFRQAGMVLQRRTGIRGYIAPIGSHLSDEPRPPAARSKTTNDTKAVKDRE